MPNVKMSCFVPQEVYEAARNAATNGRASLPVWLREVVFKALSFTPSAPDDPATRYKLKPSFRRILEILADPGMQRPASTSVIIDKAACSLQGGYATLRELTRAGLIDRCENQQNKGAGAPLKTYAISEFGVSVLAADRNHLATVHEEYQQHTAQLSKQYYQGNGLSPKQTDDACRQLAHHSLYYIAMAQLKRSIESEADVDAMKERHEALKRTSDSEVSKGEYTYAALYEALTKKIESLGGERAISQRFNGAGPDGDANQDT